MAGAGAAAAGAALLRRTGAADQAGGVGRGAGIVLKTRQEKIQDNFQNLDKIPAPKKILDIE